MDASINYHKLTTQRPVTLDQLPKDESGIYLLWNHLGEACYPGCTVTDGFHERGRKHTSGSDSSSHKFTQAYNTGRIWTFNHKIHPADAGRAQDIQDAKLARELRQLFIREHCRVTYFALSQLACKETTKKLFHKLEAEVKAEIPAGMRVWETNRFAPMEEPMGLVDELLAKHPHLRDAAERQGRIYLDHVL